MCLSIRDIRENWRSDSRTLQNTFMNFYSQLPYFLVDLNKIGYTWSPLDVVLHFCVPENLYTEFRTLLGGGNEFSPVLYKLLIRFL